MKNAILTTRIVDNLVNLVYKYDYARLVPLAEEFDFVFDVDEEGDLILPEIDDLREFVLWELLDEYNSKQRGTVEVVRDQ